jgi:hypothetical protein
MINPPPPPLPPGGVFGQALILMVGRLFLREGERMFPLSFFIKRFIIFLNNGFLKMINENNQ